MPNNSGHIPPQSISYKAVKDPYANFAWFYHLWSVLTESKAAEKVLDFAGIENGEDILEVAVGTGELFQKIVNLNPDGSNTGIDFSFAMLSRAKHRMVKSARKNYNLEIASAYQLPFENEAFSLLINNFMLDLLPEQDYVAILTEYYRVLKPSGRLVISAMTFGSTFYHRFWGWAAKEFPALLTNCRPISIRNYLIGTGFRIIDSAFISQNTFPSQVTVALK